MTRSSAQDAGLGPLARRLQHAVLMTRFSSRGLLPLVAAGAGGVAALAAGATCALPFLAILAGVGGLGWLSRYAHLGSLAALLTPLLLGAGFVVAYGFRRPGGRRPCRRVRVALWVSSTLTVALHSFEHLIMPRLG